MTDFAMAVWAVGIAAWLAFVVYVYWMARQAWQDRPMRCPETGSVTLVGVEPVSARTGVEGPSVISRQPSPELPGLTVQRCGLWPERAGCARGCLARYEETLPGFAVNLDALRPFGRL